MKSLKEIWNKVQEWGDKTGLMMSDRLWTELRKDGWRTETYITISTAHGPCSVSMTVNAEGKDLSFEDVRREFNQSREKAVAKIYGPKQP